MLVWSCCVPNRRRRAGPKPRELAQGLSTRFVPGKAPPAQLRGWIGDQRDGQLPPADSADDIHVPTKIQPRSLFVSHTHLGPNQLELRRFDPKCASSVC